MKMYQEKPEDTRRVSLLKRCAYKLHEEITQLVGRPLDDLRERMMANDLMKLNARIAKAEGEKFEGNQLSLFGQVVDVSQLSDEEAEHVSRS